MRDSSPIDWSLVDWRKANAEIAVTLGIDRRRIERARKRTGKGDGEEKWKHHQATAFWDSVDWTQTTKAICKSTGMCRRVVQLRRKIHAPRIVRKRLEKVDPKNIVQLTADRSAAKT